MSRQDDLRLRQIMQLLIEPFDEQEHDYLTVEAKLWYALRPDAAPIYRRKVLKYLPVHGSWWAGESQWRRWLWRGEDVKIIKSGQDSDRVLATRSFMPKSWCYIREQEESYDLEGMSQVMRWDPVKKKKLGGSSEWLTVSITKDEYKKLDSFLSPREDGCKHEERKHDYLTE